MFELPAATLRQIIDKTRFAISSEETRYYLMGIFLHIADDQLKAAEDRAMARIRAAMKGNPSLRARPEIREIVGNT